jgi:hypothetical protein
VDDSALPQHGGVIPAEDQLSRHRSIDEIIREAIAPNQAVLRAGLHPYNPVSYVAPDRPASPLTIGSALDALFARETGTRWPATLGRPDGQFARLARQVSPAEAVRLEEHRALLNAIATPSSVEWGYLPDGEAFGVPSDAREAADDWSTVVAAAFGCDVTRVATVSLGEPDLTDLSLPSEVDIHTEYAHAVMESENARRVMTASGHYEAENVLKCLEAIEALEECGETLLDHTTVVYPNAIPNSGHKFSPHTTLIFGGRTFRLGRCVRFSSTRLVFPNSGGDSWVGDFVGLPHN